MLLKLQGGKSLSHTTGHLLLILLLTEAGKTLGNAHSLCLDLTVKSQSRPGQPWCQVQGSVDTKPFLQYDSDSNKVRPLGFLGEEVNDTKAWTELSQMLGEAGRELRMVLPVIKLDKKEMRGPPSLQVRLCCQCETEQCSGASLLFSLNGQTALLLDTMNITWTNIDPRATGIEEEWENNQELAEYFRKISMGDYSYWLREFLKHWENMLLPEPTEPLTKSPNNHQPASILLNKCILPLIFIFIIFICLIVIIVKKCMKKSGTTESENQAGLWFLGRFVLVRTAEK
ncbi:retinoic acid early transcript 1E-like isoform X1 [Cervus elaphus]|uniref:retinoic acid early transcript 1E-like isoform X1 n=1 Tax=Cervus elaphus TaxID=9860 RepID=UPI001CC2DFC1|nr:retinoic acid early transcript 1E-like isoform X1 [Cervus elaphus]